MDSQWVRDQPELYETLFQKKVRELRWTRVDDVKHTHTHTHQSLKRFFKKQNKIPKLEKTKCMFHLYHPRICYSENYQRWNEGMRE